ncbi:hypothetical protein DICSQDRAFT_130212 [Dichomitus squalens LYAD-421 SS1]|uniref:DUF6534 domain-containing protein n=1 Tax=Dichomitus squalens (strain LYAD-421) TaxID=732165 RepID=R7SJB4_DICSQ|nr:uncharacterized protein DICSQDRAFT_130212 [Dichomitus squalens LYAD-421 SS1]EJF56219.1 hypothetical protein DICSQDRAFT_130212 [Dichomitus squalens LYAD-421 SS1]
MNMMQLGSGTENRSALIPPEVPSLDNTFGALLIGTICTSVHGKWSGTIPNQYADEHTGLGVLCLGCNPRNDGHAFLIILVVAELGECYISGIPSFLRTCGCLVAFCITDDTLLAATIVTAFTWSSFVDITFARCRQHSFWIIYAALGLRVVTDLVLTGSLIFLLQRSRTRFTTTEHMIDILILYAINTGLITSLLSLAAAVAAAVLPDTLIYIAIYIVSSKNVRVPIPSHRHQPEETQDAIELQIKSTGSVIGSSSTVGIR